MSLKYIPISTFSAPMEELMRILNGRQNQKMSLFNKGGRSNHTIDY